MASGFHDDYRNIILDAIISAGSHGATYPAVLNDSNAAIISANPYVCLLTAGWSSSINATASEVTTTTGSYGRLQVDMPDAASGSSTYGSNIDFTDMPAATIEAVGFCVSTTEGTDDIIIGGDLAATKTTNAGDTFRITASSLTVSLT